MAVSALLDAQFLAAVVMTAIIWFVQIVHYPLLANVGTDEFCRYTQRHQVLITWVVGPPMLVEVASAGMLLIYAPLLLTSPLYATALALLFLIWISTAVLQVPLHAKLCRSRDERNIRRLVLTNWIRTIAWTGRAVLLGLVGTTPDVLAQR
ncbi:MAG: hypothetical protein C0483_02815 [Pirellula sp.]|nr:hypothetical protein [Pirellula sp.]